MFSPRAVAELASFVYEEKRDGSMGKPEARDGSNDDLVMALAIAVTVAATKRPRQQNRIKPKRLYRSGLGRTPTVSKQTVDPSRYPTT